MSQILEQLEINKTFFYQFALFGVFFLLLSELYMKPIQRLIEKRNHKLKDDMESSAELLKTVEAKVEQYEKALSKARLDAIKAHESALSEVRLEEEARISKVKEELKKDYLKLVQELQDERLKAESELKLQLGPLSDALAQKVLSGGS
ncbi:MAG: ATP synthase F0 subunit B [Bdellovibrionales bacterium]|nr:ATP synthase F0 subunit B [Bdellovibrionales bacterium]